MKINIFHQWKTSNFRIAKFILNYQLCLDEIHQKPPQSGICFKRL